MRLELVLLLIAAPALAEPRFEPVPIAGHVYSGGWEHFVGGGVAVLDCNGDDLPELYAAGGESAATLFRNTSVPGKSLSLVGDTPDELALVGLTGAYPLDIDSDGIMDLVTLSTGENRLLRGLGDCRFTDFDNGFVSDNRWTTAFSAAWGPNDSLPTLAFGNYVDRSNPDGPFEACDVNTLYRPQGDRYSAPERIEPGFCALSMLFSDWSRSGRPDLRVSNDRHYYVRNGHEQLWRVFPRLEPITAPWIDHKLWGMGIASRDVTGDGWPDVYLSSMGDQRLQVMTPGQPEWKDAPFGWGTAAQRPHVGEDGRPSTGWHTAFGDVQNDGMDDLFVAKGNVDQMPGNAMQDPNSLLVAVAPHQWKEMSVEAGVASPHRGRGAALVDLDLDGRLDLAVVNRRAPMEVWRNVTEDAGHFLELRLEQDGANRDAVGAWIEIEIGGGIHAREITVGGGHAGGSLVAEHFGLGAEGAARLRVIWPDTQASDWQEVSADRLYRLVRHGRNFVAVAR